MHLKPTAQGQIERANQNIESILRKHFILNNTRNWVNVLPDIESNLNATRHGLIKYTPAKPSVVERTGEGQNRIDKAYERIKNKAIKLREQWIEEDHNQLEQKWKPGSKVRSSKLVMKTFSLQLDKTNKTELSGFWSEEVFIIAETKWIANRFIIKLDKQQLRDTFGEIKRNSIGFTSYV